MPIVARPTQAQNCTMRIVERFASKFKIVPSNHWEWITAKSGTYGSFYVSTHLKHIRAHRFSYELINGTVDSLLVIDHLCRNTRCVNPSHLEPVTPVENAIRGDHGNETHCPEGHEYTPENTYYYRAWRHCRECRKAKTLIWYNNVKHTPRYRAHINAYKRKARAKRRAE